MHFYYKEQFTQYTTHTSQQTCSYSLHPWSDYMRNKPVTNCLFCGVRQVFYLGIFLPKFGKIEK
jgi:hypothetical protein